MTHEYTLLVGATVLPGGDAPACEAIAWAHGTLLAVGSEAEVRAISRGDSHVLVARGGFVVPLEAPLEVGGPADLAVVDRDPRLEGTGGDDRPPARTVALVRAGRVVAGWPDPHAAGPTETRSATGPAGIRLVTDD